MKFYGGKLTKQSDGISHFHVDITEEMQELFGKDIIQRAFIISSEYILIDSANEFFRNCQSTWELYKFIFRGEHNILITFTNGKRMFIKNNEHSLGKVE